MDFIPEGFPIDESRGWDTPAGIPVDLDGRSLIPELVGRSPTHNESVLISGIPISMASTNVMEIWWKWGEGTNTISRTVAEKAFDSLEKAVAFWEWCLTYHGDRSKGNPTYIGTDEIGGRIIVRYETDFDLSDAVYDPKLFVRFLDGSLYSYNGPKASLTVASGMIETMSPGRYVWNVLRVLFPVPGSKGTGPDTYTQLVQGNYRKRRKPQVVRLRAA